MVYTKEKAKEEIQKLIERCKKKIEEKEIEFNEDQTCNDFIKPLFSILGWDVANKEFNEFICQSKSGKKRLDYLVMCDGISRFFIEAKKLHRDIYNNDEDYTQTLKYGRSNGLPFTVLTNFAEFLILHCDSNTPNIFQTLIRKRIKLLDEFSNEDFDLIWEFSKQKISDKEERFNLIKKYINPNLGYREPIGKELTKYFWKWRDALLRNVKSHKIKNKINDETDFGYIEAEIQKFIDRLIFVCYCEDNEIENPKLLFLLNQKRDSTTFNLLGALHQLFNNPYWIRYDSDLFKKGLCDELFFDDTVLIDILIDLRKPKDTVPYDFSVIPIDILGMSYEQFIGHILKIGKGVTQREDITKRKSEGIYYTPTYIVDYIVNHTVKPYIKNKTYEDIKRIRILDPACGSGSFLLKAFDVIVEESQKRLSRELTYEEKKDLLINCVYGVDKDERACDIAKLNLSLKLASQREKIPELHNNVRNGDSLINDKEISDKAFDWYQGFKHIMDDGGFDIIIGNPPWVSNWQYSENNRDEVIYLQKKYSQIAIGHWDMYIIFCFVSLQLLKNGGFHSFILPSSFAKEKYGMELRKFIVENYSIKSLVDFGTESVFDNVARQYFIYVIKKSKPSEPTKILNFKSKQFYDSHTLSQQIFLEFHNFTIRLDISDKDIMLKKRIENNSTPLGVICCVNVGVVAHSKHRSHIKFTKDDVIIDRRKKGFKPYIEGEDIARYNINYKGKYMDYESKKQYFHRPKFELLFENEKIMIRRVSGESNSIVAVYDKKGYYTNDNVIHIIKWTEEILKYQQPDKKWSIRLDNIYSLKYILGILNSKLMTYYFSKFLATGTLQGTYTGIYPEDVRIMPILSVEPDKQRPIIEKVDKILELNKELVKQKDKFSTKYLKLKEDIDRIDKEIDELVYKIYGITDKEKEIIEKGLA